MICVLFKNNGEIKKTCKIMKGDIFRVPINTFHTMFPLTKFVIYHESKRGPFLKRKDSIFPKWIGICDRPEDIAFFKNKIINFSNNEKTGRLSS
jgi:hypothetical protein